MTAQERRAAIDRFLSTTLKHWLMANFSLSGNLQKQMSDHILSDLTNLRVGVELTDAAGTPIIPTLFEANENSYPITTHRAGESNPLPRGEIQSVTTLEDLLKLGRIDREEITFLTNMLMQLVLGQDRASRVGALNAALGASSATRQKQGNSSVARLKGSNTNIVSLPELDGAVCASDGCSAISTAIEQQFIFALGRIPETSVVAFAQGVGRGMIKRQHNGLTIYFMDGQKPDWRALSQMLRDTGFLTAEPQ